MTRWSRQLALVATLALGVLAGGARAEGEPRSALEGEPRAATEGEPRAATEGEPRAASEERVPVVLVLDASGSMWGRLDGDVKMDIARTVVRDLVSTWGDRLDLGLVAYGHRRRGDCSDIETLVPPGRGRRAALLAAIEPLSPKGKTPLAAAIEQAAEDLRYREQRAVVTLISDGRETCGLDPCAVASRLAADGIDFRAHVIGFDMTEDEGRELRCIASATGGTFARASTRSELVEALGKALTQTTAPTGDATLVLSAAQGDQDQPIHEGVRWTITPHDAKSDRAAGPITVEGSPEPLALPPGRYALRAEYRGTTIERQLALHPGGTWREHVRFGPGQLALRAVLTEGATPIADPLDWSVHAVNALGRVSGDPVFRESRATCLVRLEAGHYEVRARLGETERRLRLEVKAGSIQPHTIDLEAGEARIFATLPPPGGSFLDPVEWTIRPLDEQGDRGKPLVERRTTLQNFVLPVGRYHVTGRHGQLVGDAVVKVVAGESEAIGIVLYEGAAPASKR